MTPAPAAGGPRVGFIGLGSQGAPMARRIVDAGLALTLWARRPESLAPFAGTPATVAGTPAELGAASDVVGICVVADDDVDDVLLGGDGVLAGMQAGGVVAIHATVRPDTVRRIGGIAAEQGVAVVDAPVSGGAPAVEAGRLLVMAGGDDDALARCRPVFDTFADPVIHLGGLGAGQVAKLLNNYVFTALFGAALEVFDLADGVGVDRVALAQVLAHGSGKSTAAEIVAGLGFDASVLSGHASLLHKDVGIMLDLAREADVPTSEALNALAHHALEQMT